MTKHIPHWLSVSILVVAFLGFIDASFLTAEHYSEMTPPCFIVQGCDVVTTSSYSKILGIPVSLLGALFYVSILILGIYYVDKKKSVALTLIHLATSAGFLMSLWFVYVQAFILKSWCLYCLFSAGTSTVLFVLGAIAFYRKWPEQTETTPDGAYVLK